MIGKNGRRDRLSPRLIAMTFAAAAVLLGSAVVTTVSVAYAAPIPEEEHWKYNVDRWLWDEQRRKTYGLITPQVIIQNETADRLEGYIADANGTRIDIYDGDQVVNIRYISENSTSVGSGWEIIGRVHDGYFAIDIPEIYRDAEIVRIHIGTNGYTVDNGTPTTPQTEVKINSAVMNYRTNSNLDQITQVAEIEEPEAPTPVSSAYSGGSLIDWILSLNGRLSVGSADPGK